MTEPMPWEGSDRGQVRCMTIDRPDEAMRSLPVVGAIVLVVGPSGAGKDSVISHARKCLAGSGRYVFARRLITRPVDGSEDHEACTPAEFEAAEGAGELALSWRAHGTAYGIRGSVRHQLADGQIVVANISRRVIRAGLLLATRALVVHVTASPAVLAQRLQLRGREAPATIEERLSRAVQLPSFDSGLLLTLDNDGPIDKAGSLLVQALRGLGG